MKTYRLNVFILLFILSFTLFFRCKDEPEKKDIMITGKIEGYREGKVLLSKYQDGTFIKIDSVFITKNRFKFKLPKSNFPELYHILLDNEMLIEFFSDNGDIFIDADFKTGLTEVSGSEVHNEYLAFLQNTVVFENKQKSLYDQMQIALSNNDTSGLKLLDSIQNNVSKEHIDFIVQYAAENNNSFVSAFITASSLCDLIELDQLTAIKNNFTDTIRHSIYYKEIESKIELLLKTYPGKQAPDFSMLDTAGNYVSLSSLQGKYVFLDFAASWHEESRKRNRNLKNFRNEYRVKDFEIFQVSLERDVNEWISVIKEDGINWICVSDLKGLECDAAQFYGIRRIPFSYLLDRNGVIIQKDINIEELKLFLDKL